MVIQLKTRRILRKIAEETGLSFNQVRDIALSSQFKFVVEEMAKGTKGYPDTFKNIIIRFLGTFEVSPKKILYMTRMKERKERLRDEESSDSVCTE